MNSGVQPTVVAILLMSSIPPAQQIQLPTLIGRGNVRVLDVFNQPTDLSVLRIHIGALQLARQKTGLPVFVILDRQSARTHRDKAGQVLIFGSQPVQRPRTKAWPSLHRIAAVHQHE